LLLYLVFSLPFLAWHDGLPTGDSQKSIYWASYIINHGQLPNYQESIANLNRDPVDFYTPGLHSLTAALMQATPQSTAFPFPFMTIGFFSIALALGIPIIAISIGQLLSPSTNPLLSLFIPFFILTNFRFLRYLREPGYHYQNIVGELLLFGLLLLAMSLLKRWRTSDLVLFLLVSLALILSHQFSAFIAALCLFPAAMLLLYQYRLPLSHFLPSRKLICALLFVLLITSALSLFSLGLHQKIPHIFSSNPHLSTYTPNLIDYPVKMGTSWLTFGLVGFIYLLYLLGKHIKRSPSFLSFILFTLILLLLSQGPRLFIDIPPVRALLYTVVPLSITASIATSFLLHKFSSLKFTPRFLLTSLLIATIILFSTITTAKAFSLSHKVRTNSTLLVDHLPVISHLQTQTDLSAAVLTDDYNRRSSSWFIMSGHPAFSRLSSDIDRIMNESSQSQLRRQLYLNNLDFEKIFSLGSQPYINKLLQKHNIQFITGIKHSSHQAFSHNPSLQPITSGGDLTLFQLNHTSPSSLPPDYTAWLLRPSTIANDIGDNEDTFKHLPVSLRATRLSGPKTSPHSTYRTSTAPYIPVSFNVQTYTAALWDQDNSGFPDSSLELSIRTRQNSPLTVKISDSLTVTVPADGTPVTIPSSHANLNQDDLLTFTILNPNQQPIDFDLIALGLSRVP